MYFPWEILLQAVKCEEEEEKEEEGGEEEEEEQQQQQQQQALKCLDCLLLLFPLFVLM